MDVSRISLITNSSLEDLKTSAYVEDLIIKLGLNTEILNEQPEIVIQNGGGLRIWQYPNQFSKYLCFLQTQNVSSYIEIGCRWGGTFVLTNEYCKKFHPMHKSVAVDIIDSPVQEYCNLHPETEFKQMNSQTHEFQEYMREQFFDVVFIDGDHTYEAVKHDFEVCKNSGRIFVFHDIINDACPGVIQIWNELKTHEKDTYDFIEFIEQYEEVQKNTGQSYLGIGVAIKK